MAGVKTKPSGFLNGGKPKGMAGVKGSKGAGAKASGSGKKK